MAGAGAVKAVEFICSVVTAGDLSAGRHVVEALEFIGSVVTAGDQSMDGM